MPYKNLIAEILSAHADQLLKQDHNAPDYKSLFPNNQELPQLLTLADHVKNALQPVKPDDDFKERLQRELMTAAYLKLEEETSSIEQLFPTILGGFIALAGLFFLIRRQQTRSVKY